MKTRKKNSRLGSTIDDFMKTEGSFAEMQREA
jgi:hypothetical protein